MIRSTKFVCDPCAIVARTRQYGAELDRVSHGDAGLELHALASLRAEIDARIPAVVADARDQNITWTAIAGQLGLTASQARQLYQGDAARHP